MKKKPSTRPSTSWVAPEIQAGLGPRELRILAFGEAVDSWYRPHLERLVSIAKTDAEGILAWQKAALWSASEEFGQAAPVIQVVTTAGGHLDTNCSGAAAEAIRYAVSMRDAIAALSIRHAHVDELYERLLEPFEYSDEFLQQPDRALGKLLSGAETSPETAYWAALEEVYWQCLNEPLPMQLDAFLTALDAADR